MTTPTNPALRDAAAHGSLPTVRTLLTAWRAELAPQPLTSNYLGSALTASISAGHVAVVNYLLDEGAELSIMSPLLAVGGGGSTQGKVEMFKAFLEHGWDINGVTRTGAPTLKNVVGDEEITRWFLKNGADPLRVGTPNRGNTILDVAATASTPTTFSLLLAHGATLSTSSALHNAAGEFENTPGRIEMTAYLLSLGMDINAIEQSDPQPASRGMGRGTPLHRAVLTGLVERVRWLCEKGADVNVENTLGLTPVGYAVREEIEGGVVEVLKEFGGR